MQISDYVEQWMADHIPPTVLSAPLSDEAAGNVIERLKQAADAHWHVDPNRSLEFAERIMAIGRARNDTRQFALGLMARGDALKFLGSMQEAWTALEQAGQLFLAAGDEVGWARTRIGRLYLGPELGYVSTTLSDADQARAIFTRYGEYEKILRLDWQTAFVHVHLGDQQRALQLYSSALKIAETLGEAGKPYFGPLYSNIGAAYNALGDFRQALAYYERARALAIASNETLHIASVEGNIAEIAQAQGHYRRALTLLHGVLERMAGMFPYEAMMTKQHMVECYLSLNRYVEARELTKEVIQGCKAFSASFELAYALLDLATAEAAMGNFAAAQAALDEAEPIFASPGATSWVATIRLRRGRIALKQGDLDISLKEADIAATYFEESEQQFNYATATLLRAQALFALGNLAGALTEGKKALCIAQRGNIPSLRYAAHFLLGQVAEACSENTRAVRCYQAAAATIEHVQRGLTITLRPGFLEDKGDALRALITIQLRAGNGKIAFETLERAKSQMWLGYVVNREYLRWAQEDERSHALINELNQLRAEHQWFSQLAYEMPRNREQIGVIRPEQALTEVTKRERRMRAITEQLYLQSGGGQWTNDAPVFCLEEIQQTLNEETLLVEYYTDGEQLWAFTLDQQAVRVHRLPLTIRTLKQLIDQLQINLGTALKVGPDALVTPNLTQLARRILRRLYVLLVQPLEIEQSRQRRLIIVPYGALHFLPFQLLYDGSAYLIECHEVIILPAAGLAARPAPQRARGSLVLAHSWAGRLLHTHAEAQVVHELFGGQLFVDEAATRSTLQAQPTQILHIAAHGQHRLDQPDLSYLQLADGQLYIDDVLQRDLSYELVTLSACETGRANVAADEELIGLGRGFLYAGAGALILSLWGVTDSSTTELMSLIYGGLSLGRSKAAALREAQCLILAENREIHPAFWGAFELIGNAGPLSG